MRLNEANRYLSEAQLLKQLLINVIFIWFSDRMLFTITTLEIGEWRLVERIITL